MKQTIKWFIASLMVMVCLQVAAQPEGKFYLYNTAYKVFLSRSTTGANVDAFGIPVEIKKGSSGYSLMFLDNGRYVAQSGTSVKGDQSSAAYAIIEGVEGVYQIEFNGSLGVDNDLTLGIKAIPTDTSADPSLSSFGCLWELKTQAERDAIVAENELAQIEAVAKAAGIKLATDGDKMASFTEALAAYTREDATELVTNPTLATRWLDCECVGR